MLRRILATTLLAGLVSTGCGDDKIANLILELGDVQLRPVGGGYSELVGGGSTLRETAGVGVQLTSLTFSALGETDTIRCAGRISERGTVSLGQVCSIPGAATVVWTGQSRYTGVRLGTMSATVTGVDDNGHQVTAGGAANIYANGGSDAH